MAYIAARPGLGAWYDPFSWGGNDEVDPRALKAAGDVRYRKQLYMWTRQTRLWANGQLAIARDAGNADRMQKLAQAVGKLLDLENSLEPGMKAIDDAHRKVDPSWTRPADFGYFYRWTGWNGTPTQPPIVPPEPTALSAEQANLDGESSLLYKVGVAVLVIGAAALLTSTAPFTFAAGAILLLVGAAMAAADNAINSPGGQKALENFGANAGTWIPIAIGAAAVLLMLMQRPTNASRGQRGRK